QGLAYAESETNSVWLWNLDTMQPTVFTGHTDQITAINESSQFPTLYTASLDGTVRSWNIFAPNEMQLLVDHRRDMPIQAMVMGSAGDFYIATCVEGSNGQLEHLDLQTGEALGFFGAEAEKRVYKPVLELEYGCSDQMMVQGNELYYSDGMGFYEIEGNGLDTRRGLGFPFQTTSYSTGFYILDSGKNLFVLANRGTAFMWSPSSESGGYYDFYILFSHPNQITAFANLSPGWLYVSAAYKGYGSADGGDTFWYGADMVITETVYFDDSDPVARHPLNAHGEIVNQIVANKATIYEDTNLFASASEDGTVILWGSPKEPVEMKLYIDG
ncbi:MAG TPA: hypothetical protein VHO69_07555, partial [Phototrophicaceae bacterium]|nr:hypothetical protein [Phototrophicaceae bacterium]